MNRPLLLALTAPLLLCADEPVPRVETKPPEFRQTQPGPQTLREAVDALPEADLKELLNLLREHYLAPDKLDETAVLRATAHGLFERFSPGIVLPLDDASTPKVASPFRTEILDNRIGYLRLGTLTDATLGELDAALGTFRERRLPAAVLDLRAVPEGSEFELAAKICERFCPKGRVIFTIRRPSAQQDLILTSKQDPSFTGVLVTLTDADTGGAGEVIAAVLRTQARALIVGEQTLGEAVEYSEVPLPSGRKLRIAVAEVALPENVRVFPGGVTPDIALEIPADETQRVLQAELNGGVAPFVVETERPRMNEAALVAGTNPELDAARARQGKLPVPVLRDAALQRALDAITTIALFEKPAKR
ncbi:MAG: S41 family peptidase [Chthoniobacteraceae bacterium]